MQEVKSLAQEIIAAPEISDDRFEELQKQLQKLRAEKPDGVADIPVSRDEALGLLKRELRGRI